jgi:hypothetical protein
VLQPPNCLDPSTNCGDLAPSICLPFVGCLAVGGIIKEPGRGGDEGEAGGANPIPLRLARVVAGEGTVSTLGRPGVSDVFVAAAEDIQGLNAAQLAERLSIPPSDVFTVIEFPTADVASIASPINRDNPAFVPGGRTAGGVREFVIPNGPIPANAIIYTVR